MHVGGVPDILPHIFSLNGVPVAKIAEGERIDFSIHTPDADEFRRSEASKRNSENGMDGIAIKAMVSELAPVVREYVEAAQAPLLERISALESEKGALADRCSALEEAAAKPVEIDLTPVEKLIEAEIAKIPVPAPAKEIDMEQVAGMIREAVAEIPPPEKGDKGEPGKDADLDAINETIVAEVAKAVSAIPVPKDGDPGKDAAGIVEALKDNGELVLTLQDGRLIRTGIRDGEKGLDGFGFDDMDVAVLDDDRTIELSFRRGEEEKAFTLKWPTMIYRGVYKSEGTYAAGDSVTWGGSLWVAEKDTDAKPDTPDSGWKLAVKKGRDGKNG